MWKSIAAFFLLLLAAAPVLATGEITSIITAEDRQRLNAFEMTRAAALSEPRAGGTWRCRTIKVGGLLPLTIYPWFKCRITDGGAGYVVEKLSGSQRSRGRLFTDSDTRLIYLGAGYVAGEKSRAYNEDAQTNQVAYVFR
jgi:Domain of unknown function (DUF4893)